MGVCHVGHRHGLGGFMGVVICSNGFVNIDHFKVLWVWSDIIVCIQLSWA